MDKNKVILGQSLALAALATAGLTLSSEAKADSYTIAYGDSFYSIAQAYGIDAYELAANNGMGIYDLILPGQTLEVPQGSLSAEVTTEQTVTTTVASENGYYLEGYDYEQGINYPVGQCTWGVQKLASWVGNFWGNASDWASNAQAAGFAVGQTPTIGSIIVWNDGSYGHVAYVTAIADNGQIQVLEANYNGKQWIDNYRGWFTPSSSEGIISYIYAP
ncbi:CHAP domain-containing protein [Streptococcus caprae]|uniref:CHAP domain-containing protein n=1 Tax=Streptococcus caprae TaxID=1640501 RepID=A0ABV8CWY1_9STRE